MQIMFTEFAIFHAFHISWNVKNLNIVKNVRHKQLQFYLPFLINRNLLFLNMSCYLIGCAPMLIIIGQP